ncbi:hypothetical protein BdPhPhi1402_gp20 [Bdellovibrio phage phi1402]|uniref:hypothetical protein n=1 Tax=Bdellovibrio phage phi1402 TaxID=1035662 RepID=UPI000211A2D2|nr:hypothetical protein BdPhPhi1402_gp20 [Bdellovibrio phage phi1402]AEG42317.1 hypothetical protein [Bdellovibrio phage phi1402]
MFEKSLQDKFKKLFGFKKVTYDQPSQETKEQEVLFVQVESAPVRFKDGSAHIKVTGRALVYAQAGKLPFGFFSKAIEQANFTDSTLTKDLHFEDLEANAKYFQNLVMRTFNFTYFFSAQYDPDHGQITSVTFSTTETVPNE